MRSLEITDGAGCPVPQASPDEIGSTLKRALTTYASRLLADERKRFGGEGAKPWPEALLPTVERELISIAYHADEGPAHGGEDARITALRNFEEAAKPDSTLSDDHVFQRWVIMTHRDSRARDIGLGTILRELVRRATIAALLPSAGSGDRLVMKLTWTQTSDGADLRTPGSRPSAPVDQPRTFGEWLGLRMAWNELKITVPVHGGTRTRDYRVQAASPSEDIALEWCGLSAGPAYVDCDEQNPAHLRLPRRTLAVVGHGGVAETASATVHLALRPTSKGFLTVALFACALCVLLLGVGLWRIRDLLRDVESSAAMLLFVPGLLSLFVVRPGEHPIASRYFSGVRIVVLVAALCVFLAGGLLILDLDPVMRQCLWLALLIVSVMSLLAVILSYRPFLTEILRGKKKARPKKGEPVGRPATRRLGTLLVAGNTGRGRRGRHGLREPVSSRLAERLGRNPRLTACAASLVAAAMSLATSLLVYGPRELTVEGRLRGEIARERAQSHQGSYESLGLSKFARFPWTRMYVFQPGASAGEVARVVGADSVAAGEEAGHRVPAAAVKDGALIVLVDRSAVAGTVVLPSDQVDVTIATHATKCFLTPTDAVRVRAVALPNTLAELSTTSLAACRQ